MFAAHFTLEGFIIHVLVTLSTSLGISSLRMAKFQMEGRKRPFQGSAALIIPNGDSPCLHTTTASVTTWLVEVRKSGFENIGN